MRRTAVVLGIVIMTAACRDLPVESPERAGVAPPTTARTITASCDKYWTTPVSGDWHDATKWSPSGAPGLVDDVCFEAAGSYTVTISDTARYLSALATLNIDDGADVTLTSAVTKWIQPSITTVARTGRLIIADCLGLTSYSGGVIDGNLTLRSACTPHTGHHLGDMHLNGLLEMQNARVYLPSEDFTLRNVGEIMLTDTAKIYVSEASTVEMAGGRVTGTGTLEIWGLGVFDWSGGTLASRATSVSRAQVSVSANLNLTNTSLIGAIDISDTTWANSWEDGNVTGHVGVNTDLGLTGHRDVTLNPPSSDPPSTPVQILGKLTVHNSVSSLYYLDVHGNRLEVLGSIETSTSSAFDFTEIVNRGTMTLNGFAHMYYGRLHNRGTIRAPGNSGLWMWWGGSFVAHQSGSMTGTLGLWTATLEGNGSVGDVTVYDGTVEPGRPSAPLGALTVKRLTLTAAARVVLDFAGPNAGQYDVIHSLGPVTYAGEIEARYPTGGWVSGKCGERLSVITLGKPGSGSGHFASYISFPNGPRSGWRAFYSPSALYLTGYDPTEPIAGFHPRAVALSEGAGGSSVNVCLGTTTPTKNVVLTQESLSTSQVSVFPDSVRFTAADWMLPRQVSLTAVDDTLGEGPHAALVRFLTSSADSAYNLKTTPAISASITDNDPGADLWVEIVAAPTAPVAVNATFDARFRITNSGPAASSGSTFTITPMAGFEYTSSGATCTPSAGQLICTIAALASGQYTEIAILFTARTAGTHSNTVTVTGLNYDDNATNNSVLWSVTVN